jgi:hypothetical protein
MQAPESAQAQQWEVAISQAENGRWAVGKPEGKLHRGEPPVGGGGGRDPDSIRWTLAGDPAAPVSAHFQFTDADLFVSDPDPNALTRDLTAVIAAPGDSLVLTVKPMACRRRNPRHYAVWIEDKREGGQSGFAVGPDLNPPPELEIGP